MRRPKKDIQLTSYDELLGLEETPEKSMNHASKFWAIVEQEMPDYQERKQRLKELGGQFI